MLGVHLIVVLPNPMGCEHPCVQFERDLMKTNVQDFCGQDICFHPKRVHRMVFGSRAVVLEPSGGIREMPPIDPDTFFASRNNVDL